MPSLGNYIWQCNLKEEDIEKVVYENNFWTEALIAWCRYSYKDPDPENSNELLAQVIWCNSNIRKPIKWESLTPVGINRIVDLISPNHHFCSYEEICRKYGTCVTWLNYYSLIFAIPESWLPTLLKHNFNLQSFESKLDKLINRKTGISRTVYTVFISNPTRLSDVCIKWSRVLNTNIDSETFLKNFLNGYYCTTSTKLHDFHYRLMLDALVTNHNLFHWKLRNDDLCTFCNLI